MKVQITNNAPASQTHVYQKVWQECNDPKEIHTTAFLDKKINYIHQNPVRSELLANPEDYLYSSAKDYSGEKGLVNIEFV